MNRNTLHTFLRLIALRYRWALGPYALRLTATLAALPFDMMADATRQLCRWLYPVDNNIPVDVLTYMLRLYGLPAYTDESYQATLGRLRAALESHADAGAVRQLLMEAERVTVQFNPPAFLVMRGAESDFWLTNKNMAVPRKWGDGITYQRGRAYGYQAPSILWTRNMATALDYFKPARERFNGFRHPTL